MASSGTASLTIGFKLKPPRGREEALIGGRAQIKSTAVIEAPDLELRTIKQFIATPYDPIATSGGTYFEGPPMLFGSVAVAGSLMNAVTLRTLKGSLSIHRGTTHMGTRAAGSVQLGFLAVGA